MKNSSIKNENLRKNQIKEILSASNAHAIPHLVGNKNKTLKMIWFLCFLISIGACLYFLNRTLSDYLNYTKVTSIDIIGEQPALFPTVTICNRRDHGLPLENITLCQTNYDTDCQDNPENYFESFIDAYYGQCLRFNSGKKLDGNSINLLKGYYGSSNDGLWLNFKLNSVDRFGKLLLIIHNHTIPPLNMANEDIKISPGRTNYITVHRTFSEKLGEPYNDCLKDPNSFKMNKKLIDYLAKSGRAYSQKQCFELCFNLKYYETNPCNCTYNPWDQVFAKCYASVKKFSHLYNCSENFRTVFSENSFEQKCKEYCPLECDSIEYSLTTYTLDYPTVGNISERDITKHFSSKFETYEEVQRSFYSLIIYYKDLKYTFIKEEPNMVLADLVSNIGGLLGVFVGYSLISFMEIIELLIASFYIKRKNDSEDKTDSLVG
jgi:hypothetical protein